MPFKEVIYEGTDTSRGPSGTIWGRCPFDKLASGNGGIAFFDDFLSLPKTPPTTEGNYGQYSAFTSTSGTMAQDTTEVGGALKIGGAGDNEGASLRTLVTPFNIGQSNGRLWFEARVLSSTVATAKHDMFIGLMEDTALTATVPITATDDTMADKNFVGFQRIGSVGTRVSTTYKTDGNAVVLPTATAATLVAATYVKLGMKYEPRGDKSGNYTLSWYVNGVRVATDYQVTSTAGNPFPNDISLGLVFAVLNQTASSPGTSSIDWWRVAQETAPV